MRRIPSGPCNVRASEDHQNLTSLSILDESTPAVYKLQLEINVVKTLTIDVFFVITILGSESYNASRNRDS